MWPPILQDLNDLHQVQTYLYDIKSTLLFNLDHKGGE